ncbi:MAG: phage tail spike protein [Ruminococcus sp.]
MIPRLYVSQNAYGTSRELIGNINHTFSCTSKEALNGENLLELSTDINDFTNDYISTQKIIEAKPNPHQEPQLYIINKVERLISGKVNVFAKHISSLCNQYVTKGSVIYSDDYQEVLNDVTPKQAWDKIMANYMPVGIVPPFTFLSDITTIANYSLGLTKSETIGNILGGTEGSFLDTWGGYYEYDNFNIALLKSRGVKLDYELRYGKNISDATQTEETDSLYSHILPYGEVRDMATDSTFILVGDIVAIANSESKYRRVFLWDCSSKSKNLKVYSKRTSTHEAGDGYETARTKMNQYAASYATKNKLGSTYVHIKVTHRSELDEMARVALGDSVRVILDNYGSVTTARVTETEYDVLNERWKTLSIGEPRVTLATLLLNKEKYLSGKY